MASLLSSGWKNSHGATAVLACMVSPGGGFNGLQIAAMQPPQLKAIVSVCSTDDRYADDVHYMGGCLLGDNLSWALTMFAYNSLPPDPQIVGDKWRDMWFERLKGSGLWLDTWLNHQHRDAYSQHGSICEDFSKLWRSAAGPIATAMRFFVFSPT
ncbi:MAG: putative acyl esterase [Paraglaciecola sp.]|jgi:predicted acyl esterase